MDITTSGIDLTTSRFVEIHALDHFAVASDFIKCDMYLLIFQVLEESLREATQNINPAICKHSCTFILAV